MSKGTVFAAQIAAGVAAIMLGAVITTIAYAVAIGKIVWEGEWD